MPVLTTATALATITGLLRIWKTERGEAESKTIDDYLEWLRRHNHNDLVAIVLGNADLSAGLAEVIAGNHDDVMAGLAKVETITASVLSRIESLQPLSRGLPQLSDQAVSILRQMNEAQASKILEVKYRSGPRYHYCDGGSGSVDLTDQRFAASDLSDLVSCGMLLQDCNPKGDPLYIITRAGAALGSDS